MKQTFLLVLLFLNFGCSTNRTLSDQQVQSDKAAITSAMNIQEADWNKGDIDAFMESYWKSPDLSFISTRGPTYGWEQTKKNYKIGYPTKDEMGTLKFDIIRLDPISPQAYYMIGKFTLYRKNDEPTGHFTLLWQKIDGKWVITSDHTSG